MKRLSTFAIACLIAGFTATMIACNNSGPDKNPEVKFQSDLAGTNEIPRVTTNATGRLEGTYNKITKKFTYSITYSGLTPIAGHIHFGGFNENGNVIYPFPSLASPITGTWDVDLKYENALFGEYLYVNLHTAANRGGEIRGQVFSTDFYNKYLKNTK